MVRADTRVTRRLCNPPVRKDTVGSNNEETMHAIRNDRLATDDKSFGGQKRHTRDQAAATGTVQKKTQSAASNCCAASRHSYARRKDSCWNAFCPALRRKDSVEKLRQGSTRARQPTKSLIGPLLGCSKLKQSETTHTHTHTHQAFLLGTAPPGKDIIETLCWNMNRSKKTQSIQSAVFTYGRGVVLQNRQSWNRQSDWCWIANTIGGQKKFTRMQCC